jgi:hypothetical protein
MTLNQWPDVITTATGIRSRAGEWTFGTAPGTNGLGQWIR